jgi:large subunit ribosomal protein L24
MPDKIHVKKGDEVVVIAGSERGKRGKILALFPKRGRVVVEGVRIVKRHTRKSQQHPQGAIVEREGTLHHSNVMLVSRFDGKAQRSSDGSSSAAERASSPE